MPTANEAVKRLQIRKYPNRRYYDSTRSQHLTLEQIYSLIREGYEVQVIDSKTNQDITAKVLAQIIIDLDAPKLGVFPVTMLHRLLQSNTEIVRQFVDRYFNQPLNAFLSAPWGMSEYLRHSAGGSSTSHGPPDWGRLWGPFNPAFWGRPQSGSASDAPAAPANGGGVREELAALRRQVANLEAQLASTPPTTPKRRRK